MNLSVPVTEMTGNVKEKLMKNKNLMRNQVILNYENTCTFSWHISLTPYQKTYIEDKPYECKNYEKGFVHDFQLTTRESILVRSSGTIRNMGRPISRGPKHTRHQIMFTNENCEHKECGRALDCTHQSADTEEKICEGKECGKAFGTGSIFLSHQGVYTCEESNLAQEAGMAFYHSSDLIIIRSLMPVRKPY